ncbi:hypothetical protein BGZ98_008092 [Dissophora globulifera]|nr:hypothetical protein BGZ98_008092 [Dissophora globulifera]
MSTAADSGSAMSGAMPTPHNAAVTYGLGIEHLSHVLGASTSIMDMAAVAVGWPEEGASSHLYETPPPLVHEASTFTTTTTTPTMATVPAESSMSGSGVEADFSATEAAKSIHSSGTSNHIRTNSSIHININTGISCTSLTRTGHTKHDSISVSSTIS